MKYVVSVDTCISQLKVRAERYLIISRSLPAKRPELTAAEHAVVEMFLKGETLRAIAQARGASIRTVANQVQSVYRKLRVSSRSELVRAFGSGPNGAG